MKELVWLVGGTSGGVCMYITHIHTYTPSTAIHTYPHPHIYTHPQKTTGLKVMGGTKGRKVSTTKGRQTQVTTGTGTGTREGAVSGWFMYMYTKNNVYIHPKKKYCVHRSTTHHPIYTPAPSQTNPIQYTYKHIYIHTHNQHAHQGSEVLIFEDTFEELDMDIWAHDITMAGGGNWWVGLIMYIYIYTWICTCIYIWVDWFLIH